MGCQIFFLMSSFCLTYSLTKNNSIIEFYKKRILRIVPGYYTIIFINFLLMISSLILFSKNYFRTSTNAFDYIVNLLLLNGLIPGTANNHVVLGGWYVGTSIILYLIFPFLYKLYFSIHKVNRHLYFPIITFALCYILIAIVEFVFGVKCANNSFLYFSFINQLPVFVLGLSLYDIINKNLIIKYLKLKTILFLLLSCVVFYNTQFNSFIIAPFAFTISILYLFLICYNSQPIYDNKFLKILTKFSNESYSIYLTHTFVIYYIFGILIIKVLRTVGLYPSSTIIYFLLLPITYIMVYIVGKWFNIYLKKLVAITAKSRMEVN